tara:strand:- start:3523 stop:5415 length:1893 start_codon:yes stop_codon:yes gene_type:complete
MLKIFFMKNKITRTISCFFAFCLILLILESSNSVCARVILGTGTASLIGGDLTDEDDDGIDGTDDAAGNWDWTSILASSENAWTSEGAYNVFDNKVGSGDSKWCCGGPTQWIYVQFSTSYVLTHFTITSGNDAGDRDPDQWEIQGSNDGTNWTTIFEYDDDGTSPFTARQQVIRYNGSGDDFDTPAAYSYFRYIVTSVVSGTMHQINELEFFGTESSSSSSSGDPLSDPNLLGSIETQSKEVAKFIEQSTSSISNRLKTLRKNRLNNHSSTQNINFDFGNSKLNSLANYASLNNSLVSKKISTFLPENWSSWTEASVSMTKIGHTDYSSTKEIGLKGLVVGMDKKINNNDFFGFALQYGESDSDIGSNTDLKSKSYNLSVYRTIPLNDDHFIEGLFGFGIIDTNTARNDGTYDMTGDRSGKQIFGSINYGKKIAKGNFDLTPIARINLGHTKLDSYDESGTNALAHGSQEVETGLVSLGLEANHNLKSMGGNLEPFGTFEYTFDFSEITENNMAYISDPSTTYIYEGKSNSSHFISSEVGFNYEVQQVNIFTSYKRIEGSDYEHTNIIKFGVNLVTIKQTKYVFKINGNEQLSANLNIGKKVQDFDIDLIANRSFDNSTKEVNLQLSRKF